MKLVGDDAATVEIKHDPKVTDGRSVTMYVEAQTDVGPVSVTLWLSPKSARRVAEILQETADEVG